MTFIPVFPFYRLTRREAGLIRLKYQSNAICQEGNDTSCLPDGINSAPRTLVECVAGRKMQRILHFH